MDIYRVISGKISTSVLSDTHEKAAIGLIKNYWKSTLGAEIAALKKGDPESKEQRFETDKLIKDENRISEN